MSRILINEDNSHFFISRNQDEMNETEINQFIDQYTGTQVDKIIFSVNSMRTSFKSQIWENVWDGYDPAGGDDQPILFPVPKQERDIFRKWLHNTWFLNEKGIDIYKMWLQRCRKNNISPWVSVRMNDVHNAHNEKHPIHSNFWKNSPQLRRVQEPSFVWTDKALDYGKEEVRDHYYSLIKEIIQNYDVDGLELDWMRFSYHFRPGYESEGAILLTEFMRDVRSLLDDYENKRGHKVKLGVRVPSRPESALGLGLDAVSWAKHNLIDSLVITPFWVSIDNDMPVELWKSLLSGTGVKLIAGLELNIRSHPKSEYVQKNSIETVRGSAASYLSRGADAIYLFNYMDNDMDDATEYKQMLKEIGNLETLSDKSRRHIVTFNDTWAPGEPQYSLLTAAISGEKFSQFKVHTGIKPNKGSASVVFGIKDDEEVNLLHCSVRVNGFECAYEGRVSLPKPSPEGAVFKFNISLEGMHDGYNLIEIKSKHNFEIDWLEFAYLI